MILRLSSVTWQYRERVITHNTAQVAASTAYVADMVGFSTRRVLFEKGQFVSCCPSRISNMVEVAELEGPFTEYHACIFCSFSARNCREIALC